MSVGSGGGSERSTPVTSRSQFFRSPKRRSLIATSNSTAGAVAATSSPMPIRQRKSSLSFTSPCRSFPGNFHIWLSALRYSLLKPLQHCKFYTIIWSQLLELLGSLSALIPFPIFSPFFFSSLIWIFSDFYPPNYLPKKMLIDWRDVKSIG